MKVLISTGNGRLHLIESAKYLKKKNIDVDVLTGGLPKNTQGITVKLASFLTGHKNLVAGIDKSKTINNKKILNIKNIRNLFFLYCTIVINIILQFQQ